MQHINVHNPFGAAFATVHLNREEQPKGRKYPHEIPLLCFSSENQRQYPFGTVHRLLFYVASEMKTSCILLLTATLSINEYSMSHIRVQR